MPGSVPQPGKLESQLVLAEFRAREALLHERLRGLAAREGLVGFADVTGIHQRDDRPALAARAGRELCVGAVLHAHADGEAAALAPGVEKEARECQGWERGLDGGGARPVVLQPGAKTRVAK